MNVPMSEKLSPGDLRVPPFLDAAHRRSLAPAAAFERDERQRLYPKRIRDGQIEQGDAEADYLAWWEIARWCVGETPDPQHLPAMELAAARAHQAGEAAVEKGPADQARLARRDAVAAIHEALSRFRAWLVETNAAARAQAAERRKAA